MIHAAILRAAALLIPRDLRAEWLEEWAAELAFVRSESPRGATMFCLGAFRDALWLRRNTPASESRGILVKSPLRCLLLLTAVAGLTVGIAWRLPGTRGILEPFAHPDGDRLVMISRPVGKFTVEQYRWLEQRLPAEFARGLMSDHGLVLARRKAGAPAHAGARWRISIPKEDGDRATFDCTVMDPWRPFFVLLWLAVMSLPVLIGSTSLCIGEYPGDARTRLRLWGFFVAKLVLVVTIVFFAILDLGSASTVEIRPHGLVMGFVLAFRWALQDQRRRCPVCLRCLTNPVRFGGASHAFLDWYGTELICAEGHGMMHVPEIPSSSYSAPRWVSLGA